MSVARIHIYISTVMDVYVVGLKIVLVNVIWVALHDILGVIILHMR